MQNEFIKKMTLDSDIFDQLRTDFNFVLQRLIGNMLEKESNDGSMTLKLDISLDNEYIPNFDENVDGETREIHKPKFKHKVTSSVQIKDEKSGNMDSEMELVMDENGCYVLKPIANTTQRTIFDNDFQKKDQSKADVAAEEEAALPGRKVIGLPGQVSDPDVIDVPPEEVKEAPPEETPEEDAGEETQGDNSTEELEDATDALFNDDYNYDDPEEEE